MKRIYFLTLVLIVLSANVVFAQKTNTNQPAPKKNKGYLVGPGDKIEGKVLGEDQFSFFAFVDENGNLTVPFDEEPIPAQCRTERELRSEVTKRVAKYVRNPMVSVYVADRRKPVPVVVSGEVRTPQRVELRREARLIELLAFSGGVKEEAGGIVRVFRPQLPVCADPDMAANWREESNDGIEVPSRMYSLSGIQKGTNASNPIVYPGDIIVVEKADPVYITGEVVSKTGVYIKEGGLSLTQALAMVGGVRTTAKTKDIRIYRRKPDSVDRELISANLKMIQKKQQKDIMLEPLDIIEVGKKRKSIGQIVFEIATGAGRSAAQSFATGGARVLY